MHSCFHTSQEALATLRVADAISVVAMVFALEGARADATARLYLRAAISQRSRDRGDKRR